MLPANRMTTPKEAPLDLYKAKHAAASAEAARTKRSADLVASIRLIVFLGLVGALGAAVWVNPPLFGPVFGGTLLLFVLLVVLHARMFISLERQEKKVEYYALGIGRLEKPSETFLREGTTTISPSHPFLYDLDLAGKGDTLLRRLDTTWLPAARRVLMSLLAGEWGSTETSVARQRSIQALRDKIDLRAEVFVAGAVVAPTVEIDDLVKWAEGESSRTFLPKPIAVLLTAAILGVALFGSVVGPSYLVAIAYGVGLVLSGLVARSADRSVAEADRIRRELRVYEQIVMCFSSDPTLRDAVAPVKAPTGAEGAFKQIARVLDLAGARENGGFRIFVAPFFLWDVHVTNAMDVWRKRWGKELRGWIEAMAEFEVLLSLSQYAFEHPEACLPELAPSAVWSAEGLVHPLLLGGVPGDPPKLEARSLVLVTGSNMSGKSTLLRSAGLSIVMARMGLPVSAKRATVGTFELVTSIRTDDSLSGGVSRFYAELLRLRLVIDRVAAGKSVLYLLDEILHGTNHRERVEGAKQYLSRLLASDALGCVSTHDFALAELEGAYPENVTNVHFEEQVNGDQMTFDYKLRPGVVQSSNALRLMRSLGLIS